VGSRLVRHDIDDNEDNDVNVECLIMCCNFKDCKRNIIFITLTRARKEDTRSIMVFKFDTRNSVTQGASHCRDSFVRHGSAEFCILSFKSKVLA